MRDATRFAPDCANEYYAPDDSSVPTVPHDCDGLQAYDEPTLNRDEDCVSSHQKKRCSSPVSRCPLAGGAR